MDRAINKLDINFIFGNEDLLNQVEPLWHHLIQHMLKSTTHFKSYYQTITFTKRKNALLKKSANGEMHIAIAADKATGEKVGYCISSFSADKTGEVDSLFVSEQYRGLGVGTALMKDALDWMDVKGSEIKVVEVGQGNEVAFNFYSRFGFKPRKTVLQQT